ncbi:MAG: hypothetical protein DDT41_01383 [candidate division WS2 bacterium]|nr:hypothetical protein [Candidatus Psychracetigena formicireducens]
MRFKHTLVIGDSENMEMLKDGSVGLVVTSPPYYQMRGELKYSNYDAYLEKMKNVFAEVYRVLRRGRICAVNVSSYTEDGVRYCIPAHFLVLLEGLGFTFCEEIIWVRPEGFVGAGGRRVGNVIQHPYPLYYYPNWLHETIWVVSKGDVKRGAKTQLGKLEDSVINIRKYINYASTVWRMQTASNHGHCAMFPNVLAHNLIVFYSYVGDVVLDPFVGSGTTMAEAKKVRRSSVGFEINGEYEALIKEKVGWLQTSFADEIEYEVIGGKNNE